MGEKRFTVKTSDSGDYDIWDNLKQEYFIADGSLPVNSFAREIVDKLNELYDENEQLRQNKPQFKNYYKGKTSDEWTIEMKDKEIKKLREENYDLRWRWNNLKGIALVEYSDGNAKKIPLFYEVMTKLENGEFEDE